MKIDLTDEARDFGGYALSAFDAAGGDTLIEQAEDQPDGRAALVEPVLAELGVWDLDPRASVDELEAAAAVCRSAGARGLPYPLAERLARPTGDADVTADALVVVADVRPSAPVVGLDQRWLAVDLAGRRSRLTARPQPIPPRKSAFVAEVDLEPLDEVAAREVALGLVLPCWTLLGMLDRAMELTQTYVADRHQFGKPLAAFQSVQFQLTDAEVERTGLEELAKHSLWSIEADRAEVLDDALALRLAAVEAADIVFRITHQLHGAIGFCDETTLSWLSRYSQPLRRLPWGASGTRDALTRALGRHGLTGLFSATDEGT